MKTLDKLLERIAKEPLSEQHSIAEDLFFLELEAFKKHRREEYISYVMRYNEVKNSKYAVTQQ